jgi:hypothetical protein
MHKQFIDIPVVICKLFTVLIVGPYYSHLTRLFAAGKGRGESSGNSTTPHPHPSQENLTFQFYMINSKGIKIEY